MAIDPRVTYDITFKLLEEEKRVKRMRITVLVLYILLVLSVIVNFLQMSSVLQVQETINKYSNLTGRCINGYNQTLNVLVSCVARNNQIQNAYYNLTGEFFDYG